MRIEYFGHSCFKVSEDDYSIVLDPYEKIRGFKDVRLSANEVICSHSHYDHAYLDGVIITLNLPENPFKVERIDCPHDEVEGAKRGRTDVVVLKAKGKKLVHLGDLGVVLGGVELKKISNADVMLIPVGGVYTITPREAKALIELAKPRLVIPMHYKLGEKGLKNVAELSEFTSQFEGVSYLDSHKIELNGEHNGVTVLTPYEYNAQ